MSIDLSRFQETFFVESAEHVETMETGLLELEEHADDIDLLNRIFRAAHSIKGGARIVGIEENGQGFVVVLGEDGHNRGAFLQLN